MSRTSASFSNGSTSSAAPTAAACFATTFGIGRAAANRAGEASGREILRCGPGNAESCGTCTPGHRASIHRGTVPDASARVTVCNASANRKEDCKAHCDDASVKGAEPLHYCFKMLGPFDAPRLKIDRARKHLAELKSEIDAYIGREPFALVVEEWALNKPGDVVHHAWVIRIREQVPTSLAPVLGDVVHNLRSALDVMACDLVRLNNKSVKGVCFPFCDQPEALDKMIKEKNIRRAGPEVVSMLRSLKPYRGGNAALRAIHDLDILDKHQALVPVIAAAASPSGTFGFPGNEPANIPSIPSRIDRDGQYLMVMPPTSNLPLGMKLPARWWLMFGPEAAPYDGHEIIHTLHEFTKLVDGIVDLFASRFARKPSPSGN